MPTKPLEQTSLKRPFAVLAAFPFGGGYSAVFVVATVRTGRSTPDVRTLVAGLLTFVSQDLESVIEDILDTKIVSFHTDISTVTGEKVILFSLATPVLYV